MPKSPSLTAWLWLFSKAGRAKATLKPLSRPGLAWPISAGLGLAHGLRPGRKSTSCEWHLGKQTPSPVAEGLGHGCLRLIVGLVTVHRTTASYGSVIWGP